MLRYTTQNTTSVIAGGLISLMLLILFVSIGNFNQQSVLYIGISKTEAALKGQLLHIYRYAQSHAKTMSSPETMLSTVEMPKNAKNVFDIFPAATANLYGIISNKKKPSAYKIGVLYVNEEYTDITSGQIRGLLRKAESVHAFNKAMEDTENNSYFSSSLHFIGKSDVNYRFAWIITKIAPKNQITLGYGFTAMLLDMDKIVPPQKKHNIVLKGPFLADTLAEEKKTEVGILQSSFTRLISIFRSPPYVTEVPIKIGNQIYKIQGEIERVTITTLSSTTLISATAAGLAIVSWLFLLFQSERRTVQELKAKNQITLKKIEGTHQKLLHSEARFRHLVESTHVIPWIADLEEQNFVYIGPQIEKLTGYPLENWRRPGFLLSHLHPQDRDKFTLQQLQSHQEKKYITLEYRIRTAQGETLYIRNMFMLLPPRKTKIGGQKKQLAQGFLLDITEMKEVQIALDKARRLAEVANRTKSEFLANMSHELRTPLNAIIGFSEIMKDGIFGRLNARYEEYADSIYVSGKHLLSLINDVLDLSKIESGRFDLNEDVADIAVLLESCTSLLLESTKNAAITINLNIEDNLPLMMIDERRIRQVILNILSNAIKFTPKDGKITVEANRISDNNGLIICIKDTGIGIAPKDIETAFEKFGQINSGTAQEHTGTGLGLPIAKSLVELHGGSIALESIEQHGTTVTIKIPKGRFVSAPETIDL